MDGFGISPIEKGNAISKAHKPNLERLWMSYPTTTLAASGLAVGLPLGQMGNSEAGHLNLGGGRIVYQDYIRISQAVKNSTFEKNPVLLKAMEKARTGKMHLIGLLSDGGVHSHITHLYALLETAKKHGLEKVYVHAILDGRDVPPHSALTYVRELEEKLKQIGTGKIATVSGRYYTMDKGKHWDRVEKAYQCLTYGVGYRAETTEKAVEKGYDRGENDEFIQPTIVDSNGLVQDGDSIIFFNFRPDGAREITRALIDKEFKYFSTNLMQIYYTSMTQYDASLNAPMAFQAQNPSYTLGQVISFAGLRQLRIAETEKYAHITYFFNGGKELPNLREDRVIIPSPKVATYDMLPQMSAYEVKDELIACIDSGKYDLIVLNLANPDIVGHTGIFDATVKAIEVVDSCVGEIVDKILDKGGAVLLTADHGNAEKMIDLISGQPHTAHTTNPVPFTLIINDGKEYGLRENGILADIAPTVLQLMHIPQPGAMSGKTLISA